MSEADHEEAMADLHAHAALLKDEQCAYKLIEGHQRRPKTMEKHPDMDMPLPSQENVVRVKGKALYNIQLPFEKRNEPYCQSSTKPTIEQVVGLDDAEGVNGDDE